MTLKHNGSLSRRDLMRLTGLAAGATVLPEAAEAAELQPAEALLPPGVRAVWDVKLAHSDRTSTRERICLNGLWRWQPAEAEGDRVPSGSWGFFKTPGSWPGITDYLQKDSQTVFVHPDWKGYRPAAIASAWYQREITIPAGWRGRRIALSAEQVNSLVVLFVDGKRAGEIRFPGGEIDVTDLCSAGAAHLISMHVTAMPLKAVMLSYTDTGAARQVKGEVARRGLCGDVTLLSHPKGPRVEDFSIDTSVRGRSIRLDCLLSGLRADGEYTLQAEVRFAPPPTSHAADPGLGSASSRRPPPLGVRSATGTPTVRRFSSPAFRKAELKADRITLSDSWLPAELWDLNTPENQYTVQVSLQRKGGGVLDTAHARRFGFREFSIQGRDFYLNGKRIYLSAIPVDNAQVGAAWATYAAARETFGRMKTFGINFVYTHNYSCEPGTHLSFSEILRAADDSGMLVALSQPHFSHYDWRAPDADASNGYAHHAEFYVRVARDHPSVVAYAMSHNATSYVDDMNPDMIDGIRDPREPYAQNNARLALRAEAIVKGLDPGRIVYHHSSGNLGSMHTSNFYVNFAPIQELSDWFAHWASAGVKPLFLCEYGVPFSWDWTMYRGWYNGKRDWGSAAVPWEFCLAEWDAQFFGDRAYKISERERVNLRWEAAQFRAGRLWHRWDYPTTVGSGAFEERNPIFGAYITDNWRAYRTHGVSAFSPWEHAMYWQLRPGVDRSRKSLPVDWDRLQRPGVSPDYLEDRPEDRLLAYEAADWAPTEAAEAVIRNNGPLIAYIAGKPSQFTSKDHNFLPGESVQKQLVVINNSRVTVSFKCSWSQIEPRVAMREASGRLETGEQMRVPFQTALFESLAAGRYELTASVTFDTGEIQTDPFAFHVIAAPPKREIASKIAMFDPVGETRRLFAGMGVATHDVTAEIDHSGFDLLVIGKGALSASGAAPDLRRVRDGLKVIVMEQTGEALERRLGFRVAEYGMRQVFPRIADHAVLEGLDAEHLRDWRGESTILPPRLKYEIGKRYAPQVKWCGMDVTRVWRCGNRGSVASVLIEKPARGDFLPIADCGYGLQYSPLLEYRDGNGMILFCQMDVTGRTESDPAAQRLASNLIAYVSNWKPGARKRCVYSGAEPGRAHLKAAGFAPAMLPEAGLGPNSLLVLGEGAAREISPVRDRVHAWIRSGGHVLAIGLAEEEARVCIPLDVRMQRAEHIAAYFDRGAAGSWLAGVGPADVHNRDPRLLSLVSGGAAAVGNGVLASAEQGRVILSQLAPWEFDQHRSMNLKRTFRRVAYLTARLAANAGAASSTPLPERFNSPGGAAETRWLDGLYLDTPEEWDDPYRFFGW